MKTTVWKWFLRFSSQVLIQDIVFRSGQLSLFWKFTVRKAYPTVWKRFASPSILQWKPGKIHGTNVFVYFVKNALIKNHFSSTVSVCGSECFAYHTRSRSRLMKLLRKKEFLSFPEPLYVFPKATVSSLNYRQIQICLCACW